LQARLDASGVQAGPDSIHLASNPEFLREGAAIDDFMHPDRIVVGPRDGVAAEALRRLNQRFIDEGVAYVEVSAASAEMIKYAANAFLATKITFINEVASLCERVGANVEDVAHGIGLDQRIGSAFLATGPGYGGSCFPKDTLALVDTAQVEGSPVRILEAVIDVNEARKREMATKVIDALGGLEQARGKTAAIWGLTFKPDTDDLRDSPSIAIIPVLQQAGIKVRAYDPQGMAGAEALFDGLSYAASALEAADGADVLCLVTHWPEFVSADLDAVGARLARPAMVDLRNVFDPASMKAAGWDYRSLGRPED
ncbi:MAG: UDP-glucose dehydrogenase family protein, partial [Alphaproteobacteria bacterium]